jgi:NAD+ synthase
LSFDPEETSIVIKDFIKTYLANSNCKGFVIGLSGGVDSAVTAVLCQQALGTSKIKCIFLPDDTTPEIDKKHCELLLKKFNINYKEKDITNLVNQVTKYCLEKPDKYALANVKARIRMILLFEYANMKKCLVCGTSNKSELLVGYFTKFGDGGVDLMPIGDLYKTQVWDLANYLKIPKEMITKPPTAGLWKDQSDEKELKLTYLELDKILFGLERKFNLNDIAKTAGVKKSDVIRIKNMRIVSQHKRRSALIPKIGLRTPGYDWRSPVQLG